MSDHEAASFTDKWRARWPEWSVAQVFVPDGQREAVQAWMALLQELTDAAWGGSDARPGEAKLGWWMEELHGWTRGLRRHPLGQVLQKRAAPWAQLAAAIPALRESRERPADATDAQAQVGVFAAAAAAVESALFESALFESAPTEPGTAAVVLSLLHLRLAHHPDGAVPLQVLARAGADDAALAWSRELATGGDARGATRPRRLLGGLARERLRRDAPAEPLSAFRAVWAGWRAAKG